MASRLNSTLESALIYQEAERNCTPSALRERVRLTKAARDLDAQTAKMLARYASLAGADSRKRWEERNFSRLIRVYA